MFLHGYRSAWMPSSLLSDDRLASLADALFAASRRWTTSLHFNKGLAGAPPEEIEAFLKQRSLLGRVTTLADVGNAAAFLASDRSAATTGTVFNLTSGTVVD